MEICKRGHIQSPENLICFKSRGIICRLCHNKNNAKGKANMKRNFPERWKALVRQRNLRRRFHISVEQYDALLIKQNFCCAGCGISQGEVQTFHVDHDRNCCPSRYKTCGKCIRGLLCSKCNHALGLVNDNIEILNNLKRYLERTGYVSGKDTSSQKPIELFSAIGA